MSLTQLLFSPEGEIERKVFLTAWVSLIALQLALLLVAPIGLLAAIPLNFMAICLIAKRLRHVGLSGFLAVIPYAIIAIHMMLFMWFAFVTIGCCGSGSGGTDFNRAGYEFVSQNFAWTVGTVFLGIFLVGILPGKQSMERNNPVLG